MFKLFCFPLCISTSNSKIKFIFPIYMGLSYQKLIGQVIRILCTIITLDKLFLAPSHFLKSLNLCLEYLQMVLLPLRQWSFTCILSYYSFGFCFSLCECVGVYLSFGFLSSISLQNFCLLQSLFFSLILILTLNFIFFYHFK